METRTWIRVAHCRDIPLREGRAVKIGDRDIAIFNLGERFLAVDNRCPHKGGPLADGIVSGTTVVCPLHAWKFNLESGTRVNSASSSSCIETFPTNLDHGFIFLEMPVIVSRSGHEGGESLPLVSLEPGALGSPGECSSLP